MLSQNILKKNRDFTIFPTTFEGNSRYLESLHTLKESVITKHINHMWRDASLLLCWLAENFVA